MAASTASAAVSQPASITQAAHTSQSRPSSPFPPSLDDRATASYVRRTLCAHHAISAGPPQSVHSLLPPLTSSNAVDLQLYAILGVVLKEFVQAWYGRITPDTAFVQEILGVIAHVTQALEERVRGADVEALLVDELPQLLTEHLEAYRLAHGARSSGVRNSPRVVYHALHPHPALTPVLEAGDVATAEEQERNETAWRHMLVQSLLAVLLPTEDIQNGCLRALVEEIIAEMILGNIVSNRLCEPWALWELITVAIKTAREKKDVASVGSPEKRSDASLPRKTPTSRLANFGLLEEQQATEVGTSEPPSIKSATKRSIVNTFWATLNYGLILYTTGRAILLILLSSAKLPPRGTTKPAITGADRSENRPVLDMGVWEATATLIELPKRMPWLSGLLSLAQITAVAGPGKVGQTDGALDRYVVSARSYCCFLLLFLYFFLDDARPR